MCTSMFVQFNVYLFNFIKMLNYNRCELFKTPNQLLQQKKTLTILNTILTFKIFLNETSLIWQLKKFQIKNKHIKTTIIFENK